MKIIRVSFLLAIILLSACNKEKKNNPKIGAYTLEILEIDSDGYPSTYNYESIGPNYTSKDQKSFGFTNKNGTDYLFDSYNLDEKISVSKDQNNVFSNFNIIDYNISPDQFIVTRIVDNESYTQILTYTFKN